MTAYWMEDAERVYEGNYIGECDNGDLWVTSRHNPNVWLRFNRWNPRHLWVLLRSRRAARVVWLEAS